MSVNRISKNLDLERSETVVVLYGQVNDCFVGSDLLLHQKDGIDRTIWSYLKENGFEQIIYYDYARSLYAYDLQSRSLCFPESSLDELSSSRVQSSGQNDRPLGRIRFMTRIRSENREGQDNNRAGENENQPELRRNPDGSYFIMTGQTEIIGSINATMQQQDYKAAVVFSQIEQTLISDVMARMLKAMIGNWSRNAVDNRCFFIFSSADTEQLNEKLEAFPTLKNLFKLNESGKNLDSVVEICSPQEDEIRNLLNYNRIVHNQSVDWLQFDKIVRAFDQRQLTLKNWMINLRNQDHLNIDLANRLIAPEKISENDQAALEKLEAYIGLKEVKKQVKSHLRRIEASKGSKSKNSPYLHLFFKGNPGTGKTSVARLIADIYREAGLLERGHLIETDRAGLVAGYVGQTAIKTDAKCREALGGVLFVDEAYTLAKGGENDFGQEAIDTLLKRMSHWRDRFVVIFAGYPKQMDRLLNSNDGLTRRIGAELTFEDYNTDQLLEIFRFTARKEGLLVDPIMLPILKDIFEDAYETRDEKFGNAGFVENLLTEMNDRRLERCIEDDLDLQKEPLAIIDIPKDYEINVKSSNQTIEAALQELKELIGLESVKGLVKELTDRLRIAQLYKERNLPGVQNQQVNLHLVFKGNPGTGKTSVAQIIGRILRSLKVIRKGHVHEVKREDLVQYGSTAAKTKDAVLKALDGILFIDEAYTLCRSPHDQLGLEAIDALVPLMETYKDRLVVIAAGYPKEMDQFLQTNPGLKSRFTHQLNFADYNPDELTEIFESMVLRKGYRLSESVKSKAQRYINYIKAVSSGNDFGNARAIRNFIDHKVLNNHSMRLALLLDQSIRLSDETLLTLEADDIPEVEVVSNSKEKTKVSVSYPSVTTTKGPSFSDYSTNKAEEKAKETFTNASQRHHGSGDNIAGNKILNYYSGKKELSKNLTVIPKINANDFFGRKELFKNLHRVVFEKEKPALVHGLAGLGKTTAVKAYIHLYAESFQHLAWLDCSASVKRAFFENLEFLKNLNLSFKQEDHEDKRFAQLIDALKEINGTVLIVLDNLNSHNEDELRKLTFPSNVRIIGTSRQKLTTFESVALPILNFTAAKELFESVYKREVIPNDKLHQFFSLVGFHTLAIEILAKTLEYRRTLSFDELIESLEEKGLQITKSAVELDYHEQFADEKQIADFFSRMINFDDLSEEEKQVLRYLSVLPSVHLPLELLIDILKIGKETIVDFENCIGSLIQKGYLSEDENKLVKCHQVIQEAARKQLRPSTLNCAVLISSLGQELSEYVDFNSFQELAINAPKYLPILTELSKHLKDDSIEYAEILHNLAIFLRVTGEFDRSIDIHEQDIAIKQKYAESQPLQLISAYRNFAETYMNTGDYDKALNCHKEELGCLEKYIPEAREELAIAKKGMGLVLQQKGEIEKSLQYYDEAIHIFESLDEVDPRLQASFNMEIGMVFLNLNRPDRALEFFQESLQGYQSIDETSNSIEVGLSYFNISAAYINLGEVNKAGFYIEEAEKIYSQHLSPDAVLFALLKNNKALINMANASEDPEGLNMQMLDRAEENQRQAMDIVIKYRDEDHPDLAIYYLNIGRIRVMKQDKEQAVHWINKAIHNLEKGSPDSIMLSSYNFNAACFLAEVLPLNELESYLLRAIETLPQGEVYRQNLALYQLVLSQVYFDSDNYNKALKNQEASMKLYDQLSKEEDGYLMQAACRMRLAMIYLEMKEYEKALSNQFEVIEICERNLSIDSSELTIPYGNMAFIQKEKGNYERALFFKTRALNVSSGIEDLDSLGNCGNLALASLNQVGLGEGYGYFVIPPDDAKQDKFSYLLEKYPDKIEAINYAETFKDQYGQLSDVS